ncbi:Transposase DDE domain-containing protein, partial [Methanoculleus thermophilus]
RKTACYVMDKGYDAETLHRQIREELGADSVIPVRTWQGRIRSGTYRQEMYANFDDERYRERNKVETAFSVLKRRFGEELKARKYWYQVKEIKIKVILHNLTKAVQTVVIVVVWKEFNRAGISQINADILGVKGVDPLNATRSHRVCPYPVEARVCLIKNRLF